MQIISKLMIKVSPLAYFFPSPPSLLNKNKSYYRAFVYLCPIYQFCNSGFKIPILVLLETYEEHNRSCFQYSLKSWSFNWSATASSHWQSQRIWEICIKSHCRPASIGRAHRHQITVYRRVNGVSVHLSLWVIESFHLFMKYDSIVNLGNIC